MGSSCCKSTDTEDQSPFSQADQASQAQEHNTNQPSQNVRSRVNRARASSVNDQVVAAVPRPRPPTRPVLLFRPTVNVQQVSSQLVGAEQIKRARTQGIIHQLPTELFKAAKNCVECAICLLDLEVGDEIKRLPCMHIYHTNCIDDWLARSLLCPNCMEPVDAGLVSAFDTFASI